ncbi:MAG: hypothetical protein P9L92_04295 [Candidatus Electryonea clarkiae]|nr:hypothetical protein [Candidatus Electryonea clarkiae]MDP8286082.1 hypothetical protein [Candidatus Electryonea clarkiae]
MPNKFTTEIKFQQNITVTVVLFLLFFGLLCPHLTIGETNSSESEDSEYIEYEDDEEYIENLEQLIIDSELEVIQTPFDEYYEEGTDLAEYLEFEFGESANEIFSPDPGDGSQSGEAIAEIFTLINWEYEDTIEVLFAAKRTFRKGIGYFENVLIKNITDEEVLEEAPSYFAADQFRIINFITDDSISFYLEAAVDEPQHLVTDLWDLDNSDLQYHIPGFINADEYNKYSKAYEDYDDEYEDDYEEDADEYEDEEDEYEEDADEYEDIEVVGFIDVPENIEETEYAEDPEYAEEEDEEEVEDTEEYIDPIISSLDIKSGRKSVIEIYNLGDELADYLEGEFGSSATEIFRPDHKDYYLSGEPVAEVFTLVDEEFEDTTGILFVAKRGFRKGSDDFRHVLVKNLTEDEVYGEVPEYFSADDFRIINYITPDSISYYLEATTDQPHYQAIDIWDLDNNDLHYHFPGLEYRFTPSGLQVNVGDTLAWDDFVYGDEVWKERWVVLNHDHIISGSQYYPIMKKIKEEPGTGFPYLQFFAVDTLGLIIDTLDIDIPFRQMIKVGMHEFAYFTNGNRTDGYYDITVIDFYNNEELITPDSIKGNITFVVENGILYMEVRNRIPLNLKGKIHNKYVNHSMQLYNLKTGDLVFDVFYSRPVEYRFTDFGKRVEIYNPERGWE